MSKIFVLNDIISTEKEDLIKFIPELNSIGVTVSFSEGDILLKTKNNISIADIEKVIGSHNNLGILRGFMKSYNYSEEILRILRIKNDIEAYDKSKDGLLCFMEPTEVLRTLFSYYRFEYMFESLLEWIKSIYKIDLKEIK